MGKQNQDHNSGAITFENNIMKKRYPMNTKPLNINVKKPWDPYYIKSDNEKFKYLGTMLSSNLAPKITINHIYKNAIMAYVWIRKAFFNVYQMNTYALIIITNSIILGKIGYNIHLIAHVNKGDLNPLRVLWNKVMRLITGGLYSTPIKCLQYLSDMGSIRTWIDYKSANFFRQLLSKPTNNPIYDQIESYWYAQWKDDCMTRGSEVTKQRKTYLKKSPFWTSYKNAKKHKVFDILPFSHYPHLTYHQATFNQKMYLPKMPNNLKIITEKYNSTHKSQKNKHTLYIWPDGSIKEGINNIKIGGFGVYIETCQTIYNIATPKIKWYLSLGKQYDINYVEAKAIHNAILEMQKNHKPLLKQYDCMHIITDNKNTHKWIAQMQTVNENYMYQLILQIYKNINILHKEHIQIKLQWCERGKWNGNIQADKLANKAVDEHIKYNGQKYFNTITPISTNVLKTHIKNQWTKLKHTQTKNIHSNAVISRNMKRWQIFNEKQPIIWDMKQFNIKDYAILTQLRTEHIRLNWYFHIRKHYKYYKQQIKTYGYIQNRLTCLPNCCTDNNKGLCITCNKPETVYHFIIKCNKYHQLRQIYIHPIYELLQQHFQNISLKHFLFPSLNMKWCHRKMILNNVICYVRVTRRVLIR